MKNIFCIIVSISKHAICELGFEAVQLNKLVTHMQESCSSFDASFYDYMIVSKTTSTNGFRDLLKKVTQVLARMTPI